MHQRTARCLLPTGLLDRTAVILGRLIGNLRRKLSPAEEAAVRANLRYLGLASIGADEDRCVAATFQAFGIFLIEMLLALRRSPAEIVADWDLSGRGHLDRLNAASPGWILAGAHTGNWEHLGAIAGLLGRRIIAPAGIQFHPWISPTVKRIKAARGVGSISPQASPRALLRSLRAGHLVALPLDGGSFQRGITLRLLGRPVRIASGPARLSLLSGRPIVPVFSRRTGLMRQRVEIQPPIHPPAGGGPEAVRSLMQLLSDRLGTHLRQTRGQWCIFRSMVPSGALGGVGLGRLPQIRQGVQESRRRSGPGVNLQDATPHRTGAIEFAPRG